MVDQNMEMQSSGGGKAVWIIALIIIAVAIGGFILFTRGGEDGMDGTPTPTVTVSPTASATTSALATPSGIVSAVKTFNVSGKAFSFTPNEIKVKKGDRVKIVFKNEAGVHDWVIDEFNAKTPQIQAGQTAEVEFIANQTGTFEYYCSVGNHRAMGMVGKLIVE